MASKQEVLKFLQENYKHNDLGDDSLEIVMEAEDSDRSQLVYAFVYDDILSIASPFARTDEISDAQAFSKLSLFGKDKLSDFFVLRHVVLLENVDDNEIVEAMRYLASSADDFEAQLGLGDNL